MDRCGINHKVDTVYNIGSLLTVKYGCTILRQMICKCRFFVIGSGYGESFFKKNLCESAHTDAANSDKVDVARLIKINFIHNDTSCSVICFIVFDLRA